MRQQKEQEIELDALNISVPATKKPTQIKKPAIAPQKYTGPMLNLEDEETVI